MTLLVLEQSSCLGVKSAGFWKAELIEIIWGPVIFVHWKPDSVLSQISYSGLSEDIKDHLATLDLPPDFDSLVALAIKIDNRFQERKLEKSRSVQRPSSGWEQLSSAPLPFLPPGPTSLEDGATGPSRRQEEEPMQLGRTRLTPEERQRCFKEGRCLYCGKIGHLLASCPAKDQAYQ